MLLTGRTEHLQHFARKLAGVAKHVFVLKGGMGKKQRRATATALASVPEDESRVILAMPISWKGTLQQYVGGLHRLHHNKRFVQVYDVDNYVPMVARMYERRLRSPRSFQKTLGQRWREPQVIDLVGCGGGFEPPTFGL
jgi:hypothetical protein